jgi:hypothetical protein
MPGVRHADRVVLLALVVSAPAIIGAFDGALSATTAALRFVLALLVCWAAAAVVERVVATYLRQARQAEIARQIARLAALRSGAPAPAPSAVALRQLPPE